MYFVCPPVLMSKLARFRALRPLHGSIALVLKGPDSPLRAVQPNPQFLILRRGVPTALLTALRSPNGKHSICASGVAEAPSQHRPQAPSR
jgi:hypothetical protein